jgi:hypothetical protein
MTGLLVLAAALMAVTPGPTVTLEPERITATVGQVLTVESVIANPGTVATDRMVAHLNVASLDGVYVDLEDWSADVTRVVEPVPAGGDTSLDWEFQAVNAGSFAVYVTVLPAGPASAGKGPLIASDPVHVTVSQRRTLDTAGALPVAIAVPVLLGAIALAGQLRNRRTR